MDMQPNGNAFSNGRQTRSAKRDAERELRGLLGMLLRWHIGFFQDDILAEFAAKFGANADRRTDASKFKSGSSGVKVSTALAKLMDLPAYHNELKGKPEPAKHLLDFLQSFGPAHFQKIYRYSQHVMTAPDYRAKLPTSMHPILDQVFEPGSASMSSVQSATPSVQEIDVLEQALSSPHAVLAAIEETLLQFTERAAAFVGRWNVIRYAHHGRRVVRLVLEVTKHSAGRLTFKLYFRTRGMTVSKSREFYVTRGSLIVLKGGQHVMFWGHEEPLNGVASPDGYPVSITCPMRITRDGPFMGLVQRRHDDGKIFAIKAQFVRENKRTIDELLADKVGSFEGQEEVARMLDDITGGDALLAELRRRTDDDCGGLVL